MNLLQRFSSKLDRPGDISTTIEFLALQVVALQQLKKTAQAREVAVRLLRLTETNGQVRVYVDAGNPMKQVLQSLLEVSCERENSFPPTSITFVAKLLAAFPRTESLGLRAEYQIPKHSVLSPRNSAFTEPLTRREQEVLRLLAAGESNQEIASQLVISLATVKKHVSNLLRKLDVESRTQAIARLRDWSHLP